MSAAIGLAIVLSCAVYLIVYALQHPGGAPNVLVTPGQVAAGSGGHHVEITVANMGNSTAAGVNISGTLRQGAQDIETSDLTLDYVPQQSERHATLVFSKDPADYQLVLRVEGYSEP